MHNKNEVPYYLK